MQKSILKISILFLIVGLSWVGFSAVGRTFAYFNDIENSSGNTCSAGTLDFYLNAPGDFALNFTTDEPAVRNISIVGQGSLPFQYIIEGADFSGPLCENLNLEAKLDGETKYNGALTSFVLAPSVIFSGTDNLKFIISFSGDIETYKNTPCQFYLDFKGWQDNLANYPIGFSDIERAFTHLMLRDEKTIVLNEFLPNPLGEDCELKGIEGEWVEIYNNSDEFVDLANWYIQDKGAVNTISITTSNTLNNSTIIGPKGSGSEWLVVFMDGCVLDNDGDSVSLYNSDNKLIDSYCYCGPAPENKSYARWPDGTGPWYDPVPTPGGPNVLESEPAPEPEPEPEPEFEIEGCTDPDALNYNSEAVIDDDSCEYLPLGEEEEEEEEGGEEEGEAPIDEDKDEESDEEQPFEEEPTEEIPGEEPEPEPEPEPELELEPEPEPETEDPVADDIFVDEAPIDKEEPIDISDDNSDQEDDEDSNDNNELNNNDNIENEPNNNE